MTPKSPARNATCPKARGGKLLIYHGWNDGGSGGAISPLNSIAYYESVLARMGPRQEQWLRLFMVPGMAHCGGGPGPNQFSAIAALEGGAKPVWLRTKL